MDVKVASDFIQRPTSSQLEQQWASSKDTKVIVLPLSQWDVSFVVMVVLGD